MITKCASLKDNELLLEIGFALHEKRFDDYEHLLREVVQRAFLKRGV
jgi:hypothetical protein